MMSMDTKTHDEFVDGMYAEKLVLQELSREEAEAFIAHTERCVSCFDDMIAVQRLKMAVRIAESS